MWTVMSMAVHSNIYPVLMKTEYHTELITTDHAITLRIMYSVWRVNVHVYRADDDDVHRVVMTVKLR